MAKHKKKKFRVKPFVPFQLTWRDVFIAWGGSEEFLTALSVVKFKLMRFFLWWKQ